MVSASSSRCATCACRATTPSPWWPPPSPRWPPARSTPSWSSAGAAPGTSCRCSTPSRSPSPSPPRRCPCSPDSVTRSTAASPTRWRYASYKTPTACAQALVAMTATYLAEAERAYERVLAAARDDTERAAAVLADRAHRIARRTQGAVVRAEEGLAQRRDRLHDRRPAGARRRRIAGRTRCGAHRVRPPQVLVAEAATSGVAARPRPRPRPGRDARPRLDDHPARRRRRRALAPRRRPRRRPRHPARRRLGHQYRRGREPHPGARPITMNDPQPHRLCRRPRRARAHPRRTGGVRRRRRPARRPRGPRHRAHRPVP